MKYSKHHAKFSNSISNDSKPATKPSLSMFQQYTKYCITRKLTFFCLVCILSAFLGGCSDDNDSISQEAGLYNPTPSPSYIVPSPYPNNITDDDNWGSDNSRNSTVQVRCSTCRQTGICPNCNGSRRTYRTRYSIDLGNGSTSYQEPQICALCGGDGKCYKCGGTGFRTH